MKKPERNHPRDPVQLKIFSDYKFGGHSTQIYLAFQIIMEIFQVIAFLMLPEQWHHLKHQIMWSLSLKKNIILLRPPSAQCIYEFFFQFFSVKTCVFHTDLISSSEILSSSLTTHQPIFFLCVLHLICLIFGFRILL